MSDLDQRLNAIVYDNVVGGQVVASASSSTVSGRNSFSSIIGASTASEVVSFRTAAASDRAFGGALLDGASVEPVAKLGSGCDDVGVCFFRSLIVGRRF